MLFQIFFFPETYRSLAWSCLHQSEEQLSVAAPGAHLLLPHCCQDGVLERDCQLQQIASCSGERRLEYLPLDGLCCLLPQAAPSVLFMAAASLAFAHPPLPQRRWLSPFPPTAALAFSRQNLSLSHRWQNSSAAFPHLSGALTSPPLLAVLFLTHKTPSPSPCSGP